LAASQGLRSISNTVVVVVVAVVVVVVVDNDDDDDDDDDDLSTRHNHMTICTLVQPADPSVNLHFDVR
jgi:hypothetical protein